MVCAMEADTYHAVPLRCLVLMKKISNHVPNHLDSAKSAKWYKKSIISRFIFFVIPTLFYHDAEMNFTLPLHATNGHSRAKSC